MGDTTRIQQLFFQDLRRRVGVSRLNVECELYVNRRLWVCVGGGTRLGARARGDQYHYVHSRWVDSIQSTYQT